MKNLKKKMSKELLITSAIILLGLGFFYKIFLQSTPEDISLAEEVLETTELKTEELNDEEIGGKLYVDIKGAVKLPGMYEVTSDMRVLNVIDLAGGLTTDADDKQINYAQKIEDQMIIYIPKEGEEAPELIQQTSGGGNGQGDSDNENKINLNLATKEELMTLNGVGEKKAEKIIDYREENGSFQKIEDLKNVNGFGEKSFESLKQYITI